MRDACLAHRSGLPALETGASCALPTDHSSTWVELNRQCSQIRKRTVKRDELLGFSKHVNPGLAAVARLKDLIRIVILGMDLIQCFAPRRWPKLVA